MNLNECRKCDKCKRDKDNLIYIRECYSSNKLSVYVFILGVLVWLGMILYVNYI